MRPHQMRLELVEVDIDDAVEVALRLVLDLGIAAQVLGVAVGEISDVAAAGRSQVRRRALVVGEQRARCADLRAHVADRRLAGRRDRSRAGTEVLDDRARPTLHGEDAGDLENHVLRRRPSRQRTGQANTDETRYSRVERPPRHHVDGVGTTDTDRDHAEPTRVRRVTVGADHHAARERVLLEHDLVDDPGAGLPEPDAVLRRHGAQELVDLGVGVDGALEIAIRADMRLDQVVAMHGGRHGDARQVGRDELEQGHLRGCVLHRDAVGAVVGVVDTAPEADGLRILAVGDQHLLGEGQRAAEAAPSRCHAVGIAGIERLDDLDGRGGPDLRLSHLRSVSFRGYRCEAAMSEWSRSGCGPGRASRTIGGAGTRCSSPA